MRSYGVSIQMTHRIYSTTFGFSLSEFGQTALVEKEVTVNVSMLILFIIRVNLWMMEQKHISNGEATTATLKPSAQGKRKMESSTPSL